MLTVAGAGAVLAGEVTMSNVTFRDNADSRFGMVEITASSLGNLLFEDCVFGASRVKPQPRSRLVSQGRAEHQSALSREALVLRGSFRNMDVEFRRCSFAG